ncbi:MAG: hypothetical protein ACK58L_14430 [Planctomycetota bacterium]
MANPVSVTIIKLGGSLMDLPDLRTRLLTLAEFVSTRLTGGTLNRPAEVVRGDVSSELVEFANRVLIIPGGGAAADEIRRLDSLAALAPEQSHRAAIDAMSLNAGLLARTSGRPFLVVRSRVEAIRAWNSAMVPILCPSTFLIDEECGLEPDACHQLTSSRRLPASWDITSDSIGAWITLRWPASRLVLVKSVDEPGTDVSTWARCGAVDPAFETLSCGLMIQWLNLRDTGSEWQLRMPQEVASCSYDIASQ